LASGELLFFIDDDVILGPEFHHSMVGLHRRYQAEGVGGIQPTLVGVAPSLGRRAFWAFFHPEWNRKRTLQTVHLSGDPYTRLSTAPGDALSAEWLSGACMSFSREVFRHFRFDENLKGYAALEDVDFSYRVSKQYRLIRTQSVTVRHTISPVSRPNVRQLSEMRMVNRHYLFRKNIEQTPIARLAYLWASVGHLARASLVTMTGGGAAVLSGTVRGFIQVCRGATPAWDAGTGLWSQSSDATTARLDCR
jgi:GT2 family glycosyltransferase